MRYLGFDLGASSGKMMKGYLGEGKLHAEIVHRFPNRHVEVSGGLYWNIIDIYENLKQGMIKACREDKESSYSLGIDSFCNDFGLIDHNGRLSQVYCYRDSRTERTEKEILKKVSKKKLYMKTGSQIALFNTSMQMASMVIENQKIYLDACNKALLIPDLLIYFLTGEKNIEYTLASVTQLLDCHTDKWCTEIMQQLGIREDIFPDIISTGSYIGKVRENIIPELEGKNISVVAVTEHDSAASVVALPTNKERVGFISSGTWSIVGTEVTEPILTEYTYRNNIAFEGGFNHRYRMIKNVMGLWILQECKIDVLKRTGKEYSFGELNEEADKAEALSYMIDPDDPLFYMPGNMIDKIKEYCRRTGQAEITSFGTIIRTVLESLALKYRWIYEKMEDILGYSLEQIHIVGGGGQNSMLNQFVANACRKPVFVGPFESTLIGNILGQMIASGEITSLEGGREIIQNSFEIKEYQPHGETLWDEHYKRFKKMMERRW